MDLFKINGTLWTSMLFMVLLNEEDFNDFNENLRTLINLVLTGTQT